MGSKNVLLFLRRFWSDPTPNSGFLSSAAWPLSSRTGWLQSQALRVPPPTAAPARLPKQRDGGGRRVTAAKLAEEGKVLLSRRMPRSPGLRPSGARPSGSPAPALSQPECSEGRRCILLTMTAVALSSTIWDPQFSSINALNLKTSSPNYTLGTKKANAFPGASYLVVLCCLNSWLG